jgi:hypothetical protein
MVNVADNETLVLKRPLSTPVLAQVLARINGANCSEVFIGLIGDDAALFPVPPEAGVFVGDSLAATVQIAPTAASTPTDVATVDVGNAFMRVTVAVDGNAVRVAVDGTAAFDEPDLRPPFADDPLFLAVQVGGACSVDVDAVWLTPLPLPAPTVSPGELIELKF